MLKTPPDVINRFGALYPDDIHSSTLTVTNPTTLGAGANWAWYTGSCGGTLVGTGSPLVVSPGATTTYYVRAEGCNITTCVSRAVTVNNIPSANTLTYPSSGATGICRTPTLTWNSTASVSGYKLYLGTDAAATNILNGVNQGISYSYTPATLAANTTYYWKVVPWNSCGDATGCTIRSFTTNTVPCYCTAAGSNVGGTNSGPYATDWITDVYMGSISRSVSWAEGYVNTGLSTNVALGVNNTLYVYTTDNSGGWTSNYIFVYVDWNQDGDFQDASETITTYNSPGAAITVTPPAGATLGNTVMRIMQVDSEGWYPSPAGCGDMYYGEVEDYILNVCNISVSSHPSNAAVCAGSNASFFVAASNTTSYQWQVSTNSGSTWTNLTNGGVYSNVTTATMDITAATAGMTNYYYRCALTGACTAYSNSGILTVSSPTYTGDGCNASYNMYINNFSTTGGSTNISNATGCTPSASSWYTDYSAMTVTQLSGNSFNFNVTSASTTYMMGFRIWIDWNADNDFADAGEDVWNSVTTGNNFSGTITVPAAATAGTKKMRVRARYNAVPSSSGYCATYTYGETEDYRVNVLVCTMPGTQASFNAVTSLGSSSMTLNWTRGNGNAVMVVARANAIPTSPSNGTSYTGNSVYGAGSSVGGGYAVYTGTGTSVNLTGLSPNTTYYLQIYEYSTAGPCYLTPAGSSNATTLIAYQSSWISMNIGSSSWCAGESRVVSVTVQNVGTNTWTDASPDVNIGVKWNAEADYFIRVNAGNLVSGATQTYSFTVTAPSTAGANNLTFDVVKEGDCWFGGNSGNCGPGNSVYTSTGLTISGTPTTANAGSNQNLCSVTSATLGGNTPSVGVGTWTLVSGSATITNPNNPTTTITGLSVGAVQLQWTIANAPCTPSSSNVIITVSNSPSLAAGSAGPDQYLCLGSTSTTLNASGGAGTWSLVSGPAGSTINTPNSLNTTVSGLTTGIYVFRWTVSNGCGSVYDDVVVVRE